LQLPQAREEFATCVKLNEKSLQLRQAHRRLQHTDTKTKSNTLACDPAKIEVMPFSPLSGKLNENNYRTWAAEMCDYLNAHELWRLVTGEETEPVMPMVPGTLTRLGSAAGHAGYAMDTKVEAGTWKKTSTTMPECPLGVDAVYLQRWDRYEAKWERWVARRSKVVGIIKMNLSPAIKHRSIDAKYNDEPAQVWKQIGKDVGAVSTLDGTGAILRLVDTKLVNFTLVAEYLTAIDILIQLLDNCGCTQTPACHPAGKPTAKEGNCTAQKRRLECYACGEEGHKRAQCPKLEKKMKENIADLVQDPQYDDLLFWWSMEVGSAWERGVEIGSARATGECWSVVLP